MLGKQSLEGTITPRSSSHPTSYITINLISATMTIIIIILIIVIMMLMMMMMMMMMVMLMKVVVFVNLLTLQTL